MTLDDAIRDQLAATGEVTSYDLYGEVDKSLMRLAEAGQVAREVDPATGSIVWVRIHATKSAHPRRWAGESKTRSIENPPIDYEEHRVPLFMRTNPLREN